MRPTLFLLFLMPRLLLACECAATWSQCNEVKASNVVFIGTAEEVQTDLLEIWNSSPSSLDKTEIARLEQDRSASNLIKLKAAYLAAFQNLPSNKKQLLQAAQTYDELHGALTTIFGQGTRTHFKVKTMFWNHDDDDDQDEKKNAKQKDAKSKDDDRKPTTLDIWTETGDCGIHFQKGETYLVYADSDEDTGRLETNSCHRTRRLSDAGQDLAYLFFVQNGGTESSRLEGFVTSDVQQLNRDRFHYTGKIGSPVSAVIVELKSSQNSRYTETDEDGRFVFDGLAASDYSLSVFELGSQGAGRLLAGPTSLHIKAGECPSVNLLVLTRH